LDTAENVSTPTRIHESVEFDTNSDSENPHFSETLEKYMAYLKSIKRPKIDNSELLDGVDRVSRSIEGCIKLAEFALGSSKTQQNPEALNPPQERSGDILSGVDRVDSMLVDCIKMAEGTLQNKKQKSGGGTYGRSGPKHTYSKIGGLTDSDPEYSSDPEVELDDLIQYSKEVESNSTKNSMSDQDSLPNLVIYATP